MNQRQAFTLIEMLIVLLLIAVVMGLGFGVILGARSEAGLKGAEGLVTDMIRQARHTALSTGAPVQLIFDKETNTVKGVSQVLLFSENFEEEQEQGSIIQLPTNKTWVPGLSGHGWQSSKYETGADGNFGTKQQLMRKAGDGFFISCWVRPPLAIHDTNNGLGFYDPTNKVRYPSDEPFDILRDTNPDPNDDNSVVQYQGREAGGTAVRYQPLILLGSDNPEIAPVGLTLELRKTLIQAEQGHVVTVKHWVPVGWAGKKDNYVSGMQIDDANSHPSAKRISADPKDYTRVPMHPIGGEQWFQVGLLYDGKELSIYKDEVKLSSRRLDSSAVGIIAATKLYIGQANGGSHEDCTVVIDSIRILRLGSDKAIKMPKGTALANSYRILADGSSVTFVDNNSPLLILSTTDDTKAVRVTINQIGRVTAEKITVSNP